MSEWITTGQIRYWTLSLDEKPNTVICLNAVEFCEVKLGGDMAVSMRNGQTVDVAAAMIPAFVKALTGG